MISTYQGIQNPKNRQHKARWTASYFSFLASRFLVNFSHSENASKCRWIQTISEKISFRGNIFLNLAVINKYYSPSRFMLTSRVTLTVFRLLYTLICGNHHAISCIVPCVDTRLAFWICKKYSFSVLPVNRLHDNAPLLHAIQSSYILFPVYIMDIEWQRKHEKFGINKTRFLLECLEGLI